ncbi:MAG: hypothetical protein MUF81_17155 [Verrucomicrobia bacterium]|jgi:hypothetical protein|nr:hypothetical protein [Verrucomicrobiota bacterium]
MSTLVEIETALKELPLQEAQSIAQWLQKYLDQKGRARHTPAPPASVKLPDYAARRRRILGDKILPNMVLLGREQERW